MTPPTRDVASQRVTSTSPRATSSRAAARPAMPPPTTATRGLLTPASPATRELAHRLDHQRHLRRIGLGQDAVPEVEDVAGDAARCRQHLEDPAAEVLGGSEERGGIEVALQRDLVADAATHLRQIDAPV